MKNKQKFFFFSILFSIIPVFSSAQVVINEVQLSPTEGRFIELYNASDSAVDLTGWYIQRKTATGSSFGSLVSNSNFTGKIINARDYFLISKGALSNSDIIFDSLTLTESNAIQLKKSGGEVANKIGWGSSSECDSSCPPNPTDGLSIQRTASGWIVSLPTPGSANNSDSNSSNNLGEVLSANTEADSDSSQSATSGSAAPTYSTPITQLEAVAGSDRLTTPGSPITFQAQIKKNSSSNSSVSFSWSFGDGTVGEGALVTHMYKYPGEYAVVLNAKSGNVFSVSRLKVKVVETDIRLFEQEEFIEIANNSNSEINLFNWKIVSNRMGFVFQPDTIILPHSKIRIDRSLLLMKGEKAGDTVLTNFLGHIVASSPKILTQSEIREISVKANEIQNQAYSLVNKAIAAKVVKEKIPENSFFLPHGEVKGDSVGPDGTLSTSAQDIIYEAPKKAGFFRTIWNFLGKIF